MTRQFRFWETTIIQALGVMVIYLVGELAKGVDFATWRAWLPVIAGGAATVFFKAVWVAIQNAGDYTP